MDAHKLGSAIRTLRIREGYTQQELAEYLCITDKAVSKWEQGLSTPDISIITQLAGILNTDIDNLLEGNISYLENTWCGILKISAMEQHIHCDSPAYGKPLVEIWLSYFLLAGIHQIRLEGPAEELLRARELLGDGSQFGIQLEYSDLGVGTPPEQNIMVVYGNIFLYGSNLTRYFQRAMSRNNGITILTTSPESAPPASLFCNQDKLLSPRQESEKYACHPLPVLFCPRRYRSILTEDLSDIARLMQLVPLYAEIAGRGLAVCTLLNKEQLADTSEFIRLLEKMTCSNVYDLKQIAQIRGLLDQGEPEDSPASVL